MEKVLRFINAAQNTLELLITDFSTVRPSTFTRTVINMKANSLKGLEKGKEFALILQATFTLVSGKKMRKMASEFTPSHQAINMKEIGKLAKRMDLALTPTQTESFSKAFIKMM